MAIPPYEDLRVGDVLVSPSKEIKIFLTKIENGRLTYTRKELCGSTQLRSLAYGSFNENFSREFNLENELTELEEMLNATRL